jgi:hypothetical protein
MYYVKLMNQSNLIGAADLVFFELTGESIPQLHNLSTYIVNYLPSNLRSRVAINVYQENTHEYRGIWRAWSVGNEFPNAIVLYFHAKGITRRRGNPTSLQLGTLFFIHVVAEYKTVLNVFETRKDIDRVGWTCDSLGWVCILTFIILCFLKITAKGLAHVLVFSWVVFVSNTRTEDSAKSILLRDVVRAH